MPKVRSPRFLASAAGEFTSLPILRHSTERTLRSLRKTQREKLDEFKKKTNFNETRSLLEKYDDSQPSTPVSSVSAFNRRGPGPVPGGGSVMSPTPARNPGPSVIQQQQQQPKQRGIPPPIMTNGAGAPGTPLPAHLMGEYMLCRSGRALPNG